MQKLAFNIIGAGRVGQVLGRLIHENAIGRIADVCNQSMLSAQKAVEWIGDGRPVARITDMQAADVWMIAAKDTALSDIVAQLLSSAALKPTDWVFHCSGLQTIDVLSPLKDLGIHIGSLHPMQSFADKTNAWESFEGVICGIEGDEKVSQQFSTWVNAMGAEAVCIASEHKRVYHAVAVFCSNYMVTISELARQCASHAGLTDTQAYQAMKPIMTVTLNNILTHGTTKALSGPLARGDTDAVACQWKDLFQKDSQLAAIYAHLAACTTTLVS